VSAQSFTAAAIAHALGCSRQNVHKQLAGVTADGETLVHGNLAKAWTIASLPAPVLGQLATIAEAKRYRTVEDLLAAPFERFEPAVPLSQISGDALTKARQLQRALSVPLLRRNDATISVSEFNELGLSAYRKTFGYVVSPKHWRELLDRTINRDNGAEEWHRLELYVDDNPARSQKITSSAARPLSLDGLPALSDAFGRLAACQHISGEQTRQLWRAACDEYDDQVAAEATPKKAKRAILKALAQSGFVGSDFETTRRQFARKLKAYYTGDKNLPDKRSLRYANPEPIVGEEDRLKLVAKVLDCGGRVSQGYREAYENGELSPELTDRFIANPTRKSYVPESVRSSVTPESRRLMPIHHGPREHGMKGAFNRRDWSGMYAGDSFQADDCTSPVYYWEDDPESRFGYRIIRGQLLLMIDERTTLALGFALHSDNNYNSRIIRALITRVHDGFGLPRKRFYFERSIWKSSRILTGEKTPADELDLEHTELGLREFGIRFQHAQWPRGKVIERVFSTVQSQMERLPGYVGRDERTDRFERVQAQIRKCESGQEHPSKFLFSKQEWELELGKIFQKSNAVRQEGKMLAGLSPLEGWNQFQSSEGQVHLGDKARYLLAHHKLKLKVRPNGITLRPSLGGGNYCGEFTGRFAGEDMLVWVNPEDLGQIALTSLDRKLGPFVVPQLQDLPAIGATNEQFARSKKQIAAHNDYAKTAYRLVAPHLAVHKFRALLNVDQRTVEIGETLQSGVDAAQAARRKATASVTKVRTLSRELGMRPSHELTPRLADKAAEGFEKIAEARRLHAQQQTGETR
jgi:hypothetical protein